MLQDGNYTDFVVGERRQFALEFGYDRTKRLVRTTSHTQPRSRSASRHAWYDVVGQLVRSSAEPMAEGFVLDVGLMAYTGWMVLDDLSPPEAQTWLVGEITLTSTTSRTWTSSRRSPGCRR